MTCWRNVTVDGSEIRRSPVEVGSLSHYLQGFLHPRWCRISSINSIFIQIANCFPLGVSCLKKVCLYTSHVPILTGLMGAPSERMSLVSFIGPDWIILEKGYDILVVVGCGSS